MIENLEVEVEATQHLHQPLMHQCLRNHDQDAFCTFRKYLVMKYQARFDGLTKANLVRQKYTRRISVCDFMGDI